MGVCLEHLLQYGKEGDEFLDCIVRGDESWCLHCDPENKCMDQQWKDRHLHNLKRFAPYPVVSLILVGLC